MRQFAIRVNGLQIAGETEPRMHLADFLREQHYLTGTHIGCEHGVCGACTVLVDGSPARSCITYAVACEGAEITTIEGLRNDPIMVDLREAFSAHHALQCGYCTPGMLITCRDIIMRLPEADEARIRLELSGNLCRCTGYVGIVAAVQQALKERQLSTEQPIARRKELGPLGARTPAARVQRTVARPTPAAQVATEQEIRGGEQWRAIETAGTEITESFRVPYSRDRVWQLFIDLDRVVQCMPGARLSKQPFNGRAEGEMRIKLGPIVSTFVGALDIERDDMEFSGLIRGAGRDFQSGSGARAIISYRVQEVNKMSSQVLVSVKFMLTGALAHFARSGLIRDVANHLTTVFAANLATTLSGRPIDQRRNAPLSAIGLMRAALWKRIRAIFSKLHRKS
jgi:aerobic carbon-monoxide dehydrogenase small subunit